MTPTCHFESLWEEALRCGMVYDEPWLEGIFIEGLCSSIWYSMRSYSGTPKAATLYSLMRHAKILVTLQQSCHNPASSMREENRSRPGSSKSSCYTTKITALVAIREHEYCTLSLLGEKEKKACSRFRRQNKNKKTASTVSAIMP